MHEYPVTLSFEGSSLQADGWSYRVKITIENTLDHVLSLDGPSVAEGGRIQNKLFRVSVDGAEIQYHGMMKSRAPPDEFIELEPGERYTQVVDLTEAYPLPPKTTRAMITFSHTNHFSPDDFTLQSKPLSMVLSK